MSARRSSAVAVVLRAAGCVCAVLLAVCAALALTLFRQGHFAASVRASGYLPAVRQQVLTACTDYAQSLQIPPEPLEGFVTESAVQAGVLHRADALWHGATTDRTEPFSTLVTYYEDHVTPEPAVPNGYVMLQFFCQQQWKSATAPPFSAALGTVLQYRGVAQLAAYVLGLLLAVCLACQFVLAKDAAEFQSGMHQMAAAIAAAGLGLAAGLLLCSGYGEWVQTEGPARRLFCLWFRAFPPVCAALCVLLGLCLVGAGRIAGRIGQPEPDQDC